MAQLVKNLPPVQETWIQSLGWEGPLEKGKATAPVFSSGNSMDCTAHGVAESTRLTDAHVTSSHTHTHTCCLGAWPQCTLTVTPQQAQ